MYIGNVLPFKLDSAFVGFLFFMIGFYARPLFSYIPRMNAYNLVCLFFLTLITLGITAWMNVDYGKMQCLSIYSMYFGPYPLLFLVSGISGTVLVFVLSTVMSKLYVAKHFVLTTSTGTIVVLGFHKMVAICSLNIVTSYTLMMGVLYSTTCLVICYLLILFFKKYCPIILGGR